MMIDGIVGQLYTERVLLTNSSGTAIAGEMFTRSSMLDPNGAAWAGATITEVGSGFYDITFTPADAGVWRTTFTGDTSGEVINWWANIAAANDTSLLHSAPITSVMSLTNGDDYQAAEGRALIWSLDNVSDLTGATVTLTIAKGNTQLVSQVGAVGTPGAATQTVTVELTAAQTAVLPVGAQAAQYDLSATLANGHEETLARGRVTVAEDIP